MTVKWSTADFFFCIPFWQRMPAVSKDLANDFPLSMISVCTLKERSQSVSWTHSWNSLVLHIRPFPLWYSFFHLWYQEVSGLRSSGLPSDKWQNWLPFLFWKLYIYRQHNKKNEPDAYGLDLMIILSSRSGVGKQLHHLWKGGMVVVLPAEARCAGPVSWVQYSVWHGAWQGFMCHYSCSCCHCFLFFWISLLEHSHAHSFCLQLLLRGVRTVRLMGS